jgi:hypothetical protein
MIIFQLAHEHARGDRLFETRVENFDQARNYLRNERGMRSTQMQDCSSNITREIQTLRGFFNNDSRFERAVAQYNPVGVRMNEADARRMLRIEDADRDLHLYGVALVGQRSANILVLTDAGVAKPEREVETSRHELMHGLGHILRGDNTTYNINGRVRSIHTYRAFEEAMTNYVAASTFPNETQRPMTYPFHTASMILMERVVGPQALRSAIISENGDFSEVQRTLDRNLGSGTFERMMDSFAQNDPAGAFRVISERIRANSQYLDVYSDTRMVRFVSTLTQLAQMRAQRNEN